MTCSAVTSSCGFFVNSPMCWNTRLSRSSNSVLNGSRGISVRCRERAEPFSSYRSSAEKKDMK